MTYNGILKIGMKVIGYYPEKGYVARGIIEKVSPKGRTAWFVINEFTEGYRTVSEMIGQRWGIDKKSNGSWGGCGFNGFLKVLTPININWKERLEK